MAGESQEVPKTGTPDPTILSTEALQREVTVLRDEIALNVRALRDVTGEKFNTFDQVLRLTERLVESERRFYEERDRRLTEVAAEREKALKIKDEGDAKAARIKEEADKEARELAREAQRYKDEQANKLREQITAERGDYVTLQAFKPVSDFVLAQQTRNETSQQGRTDLRLNVNLLIAMGGLIIAASILAVAITR